MKFTTEFTDISNNKNWTKLFSIYDLDQVALVLLIRCKNMIKSSPMVFYLLILIPAVESQFGSFEECYDGIYCSEDLEFIIPNKECSKSTFKTFYCF